MREIAFVAGGRRPRPLRISKVLSEGDLCVESEVEASAHVLATRGPAAAPASGAGGVGVGAVVVTRHCFWGSVGRLRYFN